MSGADIRNENSAAFSGATRQALAPTSVMPLRERPGKIAAAWHKPMARLEMSDTFFEPGGMNLVEIKTKPVTINNAPANLAFSATADKVS